MLQLKNIVKTYVTGEVKQDALKGVSIGFRENEFVSILGQSGSGKTTMLNIIGGLDRYDSGDLIINGVSTKKYKDSDWDYYRNNSIGFVFQSYNLIPHQSVLVNVELALTLAGVSKKERRQRAIEVLEKVGLKDHIHKKPNQMSGGQMQRVAIARALINNPDILLADETTGALDSETSVQIMELLKEIAKDKLVIMVTHNPELAERYSTRLVKLLDGQIVSDSNPYTPDETPAVPQKRKKISMSFSTALSLSFDNLRTKKGRTLLTSVAGSIGIIGIALILALSTGMSTYISDIQKDTMASYPLTISAQIIDISSVMGQRREMIESRRDTDGENTESASLSAVYADYSDMEAREKMASSIVENNLTEFKKYLDDPDSEIQQYLGEHGVNYTYDVNFQVYSNNKDGVLVNSDADTDALLLDESEMDSMAGMESQSGVNSQSAVGSQSAVSSQAGMMSAVLGNTSSGAENFSELMAGTDNKTVSPVVTDNYDVLYGSWPENYDEVVLVLNENNGISAGTLYQLGLITAEEYESAAEKIEAEEEAENASISTAVGYTSKLTEYIIDHTDESAVVTAQEDTPEINVLTGLSFDVANDTAQTSPVIESSDAAKAYNVKSTYEKNLEAFGKVSYDAPASISIYADSFENKEAIADCIADYNETAEEDAQITYTDYVALLTSSITTIINGISYVLIAFVAISLIVSCIMIGIITHISVMERTKEIGILRALGASKRNISQVFNAETFIIGCCAGVLGIGISSLLLFPINSLIEKISGISGITARIPAASAVILIVISIVITLLGGLIPAKKAAKKDPVIALRTE
ncbi:ABC transporter ATP-binding protein/permease [Blautia sp. HCP3S3_H10_1]|uniref:ABC transporter ATP-binding protein/permease n=1 Tax=unclassified Blautia TaxID=2648079 RepID=UPI003F9262F8